VPFGGLLTVGLISAGTGLAGAAINAHAAGKAAAQQTASGDKALALQGQIYNQTRNDLAPYRGAGTAALGSEMSLLGLNPGLMGSLGGGPSGVGVGGAAGSTANTPWGGTVLDDGQRGSITDPNKQPNAAVNGAGQFIGNLSQSQRAQDPSTTSSYSTPGMHGSSTNVPLLKFQHSDGTIYQVPADQVSQAQQQDPGGKVLGPVNG
jgi:hypothetical protein